MGFEINYQNFEAPSYSYYGENNGGYQDYSATYENNQASVFEDYNTPQALSNNEQNQNNNDDFSLFDGLKTLADSILGIFTSPANNNEPESNTPERPTSKSSSDDTQNEKEITNEDVKELLNITDVLYSPQNYSEKEVAEAKEELSRINSEQSGKSIYNEAGNENDVEASYTKLAQMLSYGDMQGNNKQQIIKEALKLSDSTDLKNDAGKEAVYWARQFDNRSQSEMQAIFAEYGYQFDEDAWCADFVSMALHESIGEENLPDWYTNMTSKEQGYCPSIQGHGANYQISIEEAQAGDIVLFDFDGDGEADHTGLYVNNGDGSSTITTIEGNTPGVSGTSTVEEKSRERGEVLGIYSIRKKY